MSQTLGDEFPRQISRVREVAAMYREIGPAGRFGLLHIEPTLAAAEKAWAEQDTVAMVRLFRQLQSIE